jgi:hypothetical protein
MLKITTNKNGDVFITGEKADLRDLAYQLTEAVDHEMSFTKAYHDFKWNAHESRDKSMNVTVGLK